MDWVIETRIGMLLYRCAPMISTLWSLTDVFFDGVQAKEYYEYATEGIRNCSTTILMYENSTKEGIIMDSVEPNKISISYFVISIITFVFPPILGITFYYMRYGIFGIFGDPNKWHFYKHKDRIEANNIIVRVTFILIIIPSISVFRAFIGYYIFLPFFALYFSGKFMWYGKLNSKEKVSFRRMEMYFTPGLLPFYTIVEQLGEAGPQILLGAICLINNWHCTELYSYDVIGTSMGQLIVSLFFSLGSFTIGVVKGFIAYRKYLQYKK